MKIKSTLNFPMATLKDIYDFIADVSGVKVDKLKPDSDLNVDLGIEGDDFFELEAEFERVFSIDMSKYRWYFHHGEEGGLSIGRLFFKPPYSRVERMPITPELLLISVNLRRWPITYPEHHIPTQRLDIVFDKIFFGIMAVVGLIFFLWK